jgi:hypothetical protein
MPGVIETVLEVVLVAAVCAFAVLSSLMAAGEWRTRDRGRLAYQLAQKRRARTRKRMVKRRPIIPWA